jgi:hypothetical protein
MLPLANSNLFAQTEEPCESDATWEETINWMKDNLTEKYVGYLEYTGEDDHLAFATSVKGNEIIFYSKTYNFSFDPMDITTVKLRDNYIHFSDFRIKQFKNDWSDIEQYFSVYIPNINMRTRYYNAFKQLACLNDKRLNSKLKNSKF